MTRLDNYISAFNSWINQVFDNNLNNFYLLDSLIQSINDEINVENPHFTIVRDACIATYDYCELKNDWHFWEQWASREGVIESDTSGIIYAGLGRVAEEKGLLDLSLSQHKKGCSLFETTNPIAKGLALNHHGLGIVYMRRNDQRTFDYFDNAIKIFESLNAHYHLGCAYCDIGGAYYWKLYYLRESSEKVKKNPSFHIKHIEDITRSIGYYLKAISIHKSYGYIWDLARMYYSLGFTILLACPLCILAKHVFKKALEWGLKTKSNRYIALSHYGLGLYYYYKKKYSLARTELVTAHNLYAKIVTDVNRPYYLENEFNISSLLCQTYLKLNNMELFKQQFDVIWSTFIHERHKHQEIAMKKGTLLHIAKKAHLQKEIKFLSTISDDPLVPTN